MSWNAYIDVRTCGKMNDMHSHWEKIKKWAEVEQVWSKQGHWDWLIKLRDNVSSHDMLEKIVFNLRAEPWVSETHTWWAKAI